MDNFFIDILAAFRQLIAVMLRILSPLIIGLVLAYLLGGPAEWIRKKLFAEPVELLSSKSPKGRIPSILITYISVILLLCAVLYAFAVLIIGAFPAGSFRDTARQIYDYFASASSDISRFISSYFPSGLSGGDFDPMSAVSGWIESRFSLETAVDTLSALIGGLVNFFAGFIASIYLIKDREFFLTLWQKLLSLILGQRLHGQINEVLSEIHHVLTTFIKGALVDSLIVALLSSIVLSALQIKFAVIIGLIGGLLNIIPYFGPFFGMVPAFLVAFFSRGLGTGIVAVLALFLIQQLDSNYIYPKIVGDSIGLHPLFVLLSLTLLGHLGGIMGMVLAVPAAGVLQVLIKRWAYKY